VIKTRSFDNTQMTIHDSCWIINKSHNRFGLKVS